MRASADVIIQVPDIAAASAFYEQVMKLDVFERSASLVGFNAGGFRLFVERGPSPGPVFEFLAEDMAGAKARLVDGAKARLVDAGCVVIEEDRAVPRCYLRDPFGLTFNLGSSG